MRNLPSLLLLLLSLHFSLPSWSQATPQWVATYGESDNDYATDAVVTPDGSIIVAGVIENDETGKESISLRKFSPTGEELFSYLHRDGNNNLPTYGLEVRPDGTMITGGQFSGSALLVSTGQDGNIVKLLEDPTYNLWDITTGGDGLIVACGEAANGTVIRAYNDSLEVVWENTFNISGIRDAVSVTALADGGYAMLCASNERGGDVAIVRTNSTGEVVWSRIYGGSRAEIVDVNNDPGPNIQQAPDGSLVFGATSRSANGDVTFPDEDNNRNNFWVVKVDQNTGDIVWNTVLAVGICNGINIKLDGTILAYGRGVSGGANNVPSNVPDDEFGDRSSVNWIGSLNTDGTVGYSYHFVSDEPHSINQVVNYPDGTWAALGRTRSEELPFTNQGRDDIVVMKFDDGTVPLDNNGSVGRLDTTICSGNSFTIAGTIFDVDNPGGDVVLGGQASDGGDSTLTVSISFFSAAESTLISTICPGDTIVIDGENYVEPNLPASVTLPEASVNGCDSIIILNVTVRSANAMECGGTDPGIDDAEFTCTDVSAPVCFSQETTGLGQSACVVVSAQNFDDILGFQFGITFDETALEFTELTLEDNLPGLDEADNFFVDRADEGLLTFTYPSNSGLGITLDDDTPIFQLCFTGLAAGRNALIVSDTILGSTIVLYGDLSEGEYSGNVGSVEVIACNDTTVMIDATICAGQTFFFDDTNYATPGTYEATVQTMAGCDSTTILNLSINEIEFSLPDEIGFCPGESRRISAPDSIRIGLVTTPDDMLAGNLVLPLGESEVKILEVGSNCTKIQTVRIFQFVPPTIVATGDRAYCGSEAGAVLVAEGAESYLWSTGETTTQVTLTAGTYQLTGTDVNGCTTTIEVNIEELPLPVISTTGDLAYCASEPGAILTATGGASYRWSTGETTATVTLAAGTYTVTGTGANGCSDSISITIEELPLPVAVISGDNEYCADGDGVTLTASGGTSYRWDDGSTTETIVSLAGTRTVTVTDANGCSASTSITVTALPLPEVNVEGDLGYCADEDGTTLTATGGVSYAWSNEVNEATVTLSAGIYSVTVTDANGCQNSTEVTVIELPLPVVQILGDPTYCNDEAGALLTATGGNRYAWSNGSLTASVILTEGEYNVTVTNLQGCSSIGNVIVVGDTIAPDFVFCPPNRTGVLNFGQEEIPVSWPEPLAEDNCGAIQINGPLGGTNGGAFNEGVSTITYTATDESGNSSECSFTISVRRSDDLTFYIDSASVAVENDVICIPVRVRDFVDVVGFGVAFNLPDVAGVEYVTTVAGEEISASSGDGFFAFSQNASGGIAIIYTNNDGTGISLEDGTLAFTMKATIPGNPGDCFPIVSNLDFIDVEAFQEGLGTTVPTLIPGTACYPNNFSITGRTYRPNPEVSPINSADVLLEAPAGFDDFDITDAAGRYGFEELDGSQEYTITPERNFEHGDGLSVIDLVYLVRHVRGIEFITDSYLRIAANSNDDNRISLLDINPIQQVVLGAINEFPSNKSWRFLPADHLIDQAAPLNVYPESVTLPGLNQDEVVDFVGVKIGDLNNSFTSLWDDNGGVAGFTTPNINLEAGNKVRIPVSYSAGQYRLLGFQQEWAFDPSALEFLGIRAGSLPTADLAVYKGLASKGIVRLSYLDQEMEEDNLLKSNNPEKLYYLTFSARRDGKLSDFLELNKEGFVKPRVVTAEQMLEKEGKLTFLEGTNVNNLTVNVVPNPVTDRATVNMTLPAAGKWELRLTTLNGKLIGVHNGEALTSGSFTTELRELQNLPAGAYFLQLKMAQKTAAVKVIHR